MTFNSRAYSKKWRKENPQKVKLYRANFNKKNKKKIAKWNKIYYKKIRYRVFKYYGNKCRCCGESTPEFLTIDHIKGQGRTHRKGVRHSGGSFYSWLIKNNFPSGFRVLCMNCNFAKGIHGYCPHKRRRRREENQNANG